ncbi:hypothetical protein [Halodurantibacterium flavum]|uniref:Uncharacterized protein n=1 Tax=Halodurantibacterium flavum TaxID=1382802 RepID=A0ABW4S7J2_9RHOB
MIGRAALALCTLLFALATGVPAQARSFELGQSALLTSSERMRIFAIGRAMQDGAAFRVQTELLRADLVRQGFYHEGGPPEIVDRRFSIQPQAGYDPNVNGGLHVWRLYLGDWVLEADEASRAQPGWTLGATASASGRMAWAQGRFVSAEISAGGAWAPELDIGRSFLRVEACSRNQVTGWTFLDLCAEAIRSDRRLGRSETSQVGAELGHLFAAPGPNPGSYHEIRGGLGRRFLSERDQTIATAGWTALWDGFATDLALTLGEPLGETFAMRHRLNGEIRWRMLGRSSALSLWHEGARGGMFLGQMREDQSYGITLAQTVTPQMSISLGAMRNASTIDFYSYSQILFSVNFAPLEF